MTRRILVVHAHPDVESFSAALRDLVERVGRERGSEVRVHNLYETGFSPVVSANEWSLRTAPPDSKPHLAGHFADVEWCDTLVFVYPTWWSGQPAILKGWFDRILMNGVAWRLPEGANRIEPMLRNVRRLVVVTTHGSPKWVNALQGEPGKRTVLRAVRLMFTLRCRASWLALYGLDRASGRRRLAFERRVRRRMRRLG